MAEHIHKFESQVRSDKSVMEGVPSLGIFHHIPMGLLPSFSSSSDILLITPRVGARKASSAA